MKPDNRTFNQNKLMWSMLRDVASQCKLEINGHMVNASAEDWKDVFTAALRGWHRTAKGLDGGRVILGMRTHDMTKDQMGDLIDLIGAYGAEKDIKWSQPE